MVMNADENNESLIYGIAVNKRLADIEFPLDYQTIKNSDWLIKETERLIIKTKKTTA